MSNVMSMKSLQNHVRRNGFDKAQRNAFTAKVGELLPVFCEEVIPGDKWKLKAEWFTRTMPLNTSAYTRMREYYDVFFVPTRLLWRYFDQCVTQMPNSQYATSLTAGGSIALTSHPYFTYADVYRYLNGVKSGNYPNNIFGFDRSSQTAKLLEYLGYGNFTRNQTAIDDIYNQKLNPFPLLAYQKIYSDYYRFDQWESASPETFNLDYMNTGSQISINQTSFFNQFKTMFDLHYCNWNKDRFMGLLPNAQYGSDGASVSINQPDYLQGYYNFFPRFAESTGLPTTVKNAAGGGSRIGVNGDVFTQLRIDMASLKQSVSILALRQSEAMQRYLEITQSGKLDYRSQIKKHFDVDVSPVRSGLSQFLDGWVNNIGISEVVNTNLTGSRDVNDASIAGKASGQGGGFVDFEAKEHGILMCIYHCMPLLDYFPTGIEPLNLKSESTDYAIPEFDAIGMQQVPVTVLSSDPRLSAQLAQSNVLGYAPRYYDYKTAVDKVRGAFNSTLKDWTAPLTLDYIYSQLSSNYSAFQRYLSYPFFKVNPSVLNSIFAFDVDSTVDSDQLLCNAYFDAKVVRNLDRDGLPY